MTGGDRYYKRIDWKSIPTSVMGDKGLDEEYERLEYWSEEAFRTIGAGLAIEIGSYWGRSTAILAQFFDVMAIDLWGTEERLGKDSKIKKYENIGLSQWPTFMRNMLKRKLIDWDGESLSRVFPVCSTSRYLEKVPFLNAVVVHIDADHSYPSSYNDMVRGLRHLTSGGYMIIHDVKRPGWGHEPIPGEYKITEKDPWYGNAQSLEMLLKEKKNVEIYEHFRGYICLQKK